MRVTVQVSIQADDGADVVVHEVLDVQRDGDLDLDRLGLRLAEAKELLAGLQTVMTTGQAVSAIDRRSRCVGCGRRFAHKDRRTVTVRTVFGAVTLPSPRWRRCPCDTRAGSFSPLPALLADRVTPELLGLEARFAGLVSYGLTTAILAEVLPLDGHATRSSVWRDTLAVGQHLDDSLGDEQATFIDGTPGDWAQLPTPDLAMTVGLDGGYVHSRAQTSRRDGWFEVIAGKAIPADGDAKCFGYVRTYDKKPKRRIYEVLRERGMEPNQHVTFLTDGGTDIRDLPTFLHPNAEQLLDWFHLTMRLTQARQLANNLDTDVASAVQDALERVKWFLWHGNVTEALEVLDEIVTIHIYPAERVDPDNDELLVWYEPDTAHQKLERHLEDLARYISVNRGYLPNYGERRRCGDAISTSFVESTVNALIAKRMVKSQQMRWTPRGAHLLLQIRSRVLNGDLDHALHRRTPPPAAEAA